MSWRPWTMQERRRALDMRASGMLLREIAACLGRTAGAVGHVVGAPRPRDGGAVSARARAAYQLRREGRQWREVAERVGVSSGSAACMHARRYAMATGVAWPVPMAVGVRR